MSASDSTQVYTNNNLLVHLPIRQYTLEIMSGRHKKNSFIDLFQ